MRYTLIFSLLFIGLTACKKDLVDPSNNQLEDISSVDAFKSKISDGTSMVFYYAIWCSVCEEFRPTVELVSTNSELEEVNFIEVDYDDNRDVFDEYSVNSFPTVLFFKDGVEVERLKGKNHTEQELIDLAKKHL